MLIIHDDKTIYAALKGEKSESLETHIHAGYPELIEAYKNGKIKAEEIDDTIEAAILTIDTGGLREMTKEEVEAKKPPIVTPDPELEKKIVATLRGMALERIATEKAVVGS